MITMSDWLAGGSLLVAFLAFGLSVYAVVTSTRLQRRQVRQMDRPVGGWWIVTTGRASQADTAASLVSSGNFLAPRARCVTAKTWRE